MKHPWVEALFAELNPKARTYHAPQRPDDERGETQRRTWAGPSSSKASRSPGLNESEYDIAAHARASLQISDGRHQQDPSRPQPQSPSRGRVAFPAGPAYSPDRIPDGPRSPHQPLYKQEVPYSSGGGEARYRSSVGPGGFVQPARYTSAPSTPSNRRAEPVQGSPSHGRAPGYTNVHNESRQQPQTDARFYPSTPPRLSQSQQALPPSNSRTQSAPVASLTPDKYALPRPAILGHASSPPSTPLSSPPVNANQCHGITAAGKRCTRVVGKSARGTAPSTPKKDKAEAPAHRVALTQDAFRQLDRRLSLGKRRHQGRGQKMRSHRSIVEEDDQSELPQEALIAPDETLETGEQPLEELPVYCFQHAKQTLEQKGTFIGTAFVDFNDWIPPHLPRETQLQLRHEMARPVSTEDIPGYIYVHEMVSNGTDDTSTTFLKLGRSVKPVARLSQWKSQCRSRHPIVRDIFPLHPSHPLHPQLTTGNLINGTPLRMHGALLFAADGARNHHRWERLCLIELAGIAAMQALARNDHEQRRQKCIDCGRIHVELFMVDKGSYEREIRDVVLRWQKFVETLS